MNPDEIKQLARELGLNPNIRTIAGLKSAIETRIRSLPSGRNASAADRKLSARLNEAVEGLTSAIQGAAANHESDEDKLHRWTKAEAIAAIVAVPVAIVGIAVTVSLAQAPHGDAQGTQTPTHVPYDLYQSLAATSAAPNSDGVSIDLKLRPVLQNFGYDTAQGCYTKWQPVDASLNPIIYWPAVVEDGEIRWSVEGGSVHQTALDQTFSLDDFDSAHLLDVWFECRQPKFTLIGLVFQLDFDTKTVDWDSSRVPQRTEPMTNEERYEYAQAVQDGDVPAWTTP